MVPVGDGILTRLKTVAAEVEQRRGVEISFETVNADPPATCDREVIEMIEAAVAESGSRGGLTKPQDGEPGFITIRYSWRALRRWQ